MEAKEHDAGGANGKVDRDLFRAQGVDHAAFVERGGADAIDALHAVLGERNYLFVVSFDDGGPLYAKGQLRPGGPAIMLLLAQAAHGNMREVIDIAAEIGDYDVVEGPPSVDPIDGFSKEQIATAVDDALSRGVAKVFEDPAALANPKAFSQRLLAFLADEP